MGGTPNPAAPGDAPMPEQPPKPSRPSNPPTRRANPQMAVPIPQAPPDTPSPPAQGDVNLGVAVESGAGGTVTARRAGGLRDMALEVDPETVGVKGALQHLAKAVNIAFQTDYGENF